MDLSFYPLTLEALDQANAEALCLFVGEDERPLVGLSGLCDWRLAGGLSRMLRKGLVKGVEGEALLTPGMKLGFRKLFLFGMGPVGQSEEELSARLGDRLRRLGRAGVEDVAFQIPPRLPLDAGIRALIDEPAGPLRARVFGSDPAAMVRALSQAASRGASDARHERRVIKVPPSHKAPPPPPPRKGPPPRPGIVEIPKASPLPFAPSGNASAPRPLERPGAESAAGETAASGAAPTGTSSAEARAAASATDLTESVQSVNPAPEAPAGAPGGVSASSAAAATGGAPSQTPLAAQEAVELGPEKLEGETLAAALLEEPPVAPLISEPPVAPPVSEPPVAPPASEPPAQRELPMSAAKPPPAAAKPEARPAKTLPTDYKAPRFVPPEPKPPGGGGKKGGRKKKR